MAERRGGGNELSCVRALTSPSLTRCRCRQGERNWTHHRLNRLTHVCLALEVIFWPSETQLSGCQILLLVKSSPVVCGLEDGAYAAGQLRPKLPCWQQLPHSAAGRAVKCLPCSRSSSTMTTIGGLWILIFQAWSERGCREIFYTSTILPIWLGQLWQLGAVSCLLSIVAPAPFHVPSTTTGHSKTTHLLRPNTSECKQQGNYPFFKIATTVHCHSLTVMS